MRVKDLKSLLAKRLDENIPNAGSVFGEILGQVFHKADKDKIIGKDLTAYEVNGTTVFVSLSGLKKPDQIIFLDLNTGSSFMQHLEA